MLHPLCPFTFLQRSPLISSTVSENVWFLRVPKYATFRILFSFTSCSLLPTQSVFWLFLALYKLVIFSREILNSKLELGPVRRKKGKELKLVLWLRLRVVSKERMSVSGRVKEFLCRSPTLTLVCLVAASSFRPAATRLFWVCHFSWLWQFVPLEKFFCGLPLIL